MHITTEWSETGVRILLNCILFLNESAVGVSKKKFSFSLLFLSLHYLWAFAQDRLHSVSKKKFSFFFAVPFVCTIFGLSPQDRLHSGVSKKKFSFFSLLFLSFALSLGFRPRMKLHSGVSKRKKFSFFLCCFLRLHYLCMLNEYYKIHTLEGGIVGCNSSLWPLALQSSFRCS